MKIPAYFKDIYDFDDRNYELVYYQIIEETKATKKIVIIYKDIRSNAAHVEILDIEWDGTFWEAVNTTEFMLEDALVLQKVNFSTVKTLFSPCKKN